MLAKTLIFIYNLFVMSILPLIFIRLIWRSLKNPDYRKRAYERLGLFKPLNCKSSIWVHAVSLGESIASIPIINELKKKYPNIPIVVTTMTPTGSNKIKQTFGDSVFHVYVPYDFTFAINNFIKRVNPKILILLETELWPNTLQICKKKNIKIYLANARLSDKSRNNYQKIFIISKYMINCLDFVFAQYQHDANNFLKLGLNKNKLLITGNIKFDITLPKDKVEKGLKIKSTLKDRFIICAASTHSGEEKILLDIFLKLQKQNPKLLLILVPRHPERFRDVEKLIANANVPYVTRTSNTKILDTHKVFLGNTMGELPIFYAMSDLTFVGGSLIPIGGHNVLEPASLELPIITGSYLHNFKTITNLMLQDNALIITNESELENKLLELIKNEKLRSSLANNAKKFVEKNKGGLLKIINNIGGIGSIGGIQ